MLTRVAAASRLFFPALEADRRPMRIRLLTWFTFVLLIVAARAEAQFTPRPAVVAPEQFNVELAVMWWKPTPELALTFGDARIGTVDFVQDFGIGDERFTEFRLVVKSGKHKARFSFVPIKYDQDAVLQRTIRIQNVDFPAMADANANIRWDVYRFGYEWDFLTMRRGFIGFVTELKYNNVRADVTGTTRAPLPIQTLAAVFDQKAPVPTIGGIARGYIGDYVSITGELTGLNIDRTPDFRGKFYDLDIYGAGHFGKYVGVQVGYRSLDVDFLVDNDAGTMRMKGPYFGGFVRF
jgi:hypothetical protein